MGFGNHAETLTFDIAPLGGHNIVLGLLWLQQHNPQIHWSTGKVTFVSDYCKHHCLAQPASVFLNQQPFTQSSGTIEETPELDALAKEEIDLFAIGVSEWLEHLEEVEEEYHNYIDRFDAEKAMTTLPELRGPDINFAIDLDPTKLLPKPSQPYCMNQEERDECHKILDNMLNAGQAEPANLNCPLAAPMFFVWKKDGTRHLVIDYQKLNEITIKDSYPLPRIDKMMDRIRGSEIFTKFNLKLGYNQICI